MQRIVPLEDGTIPLHPINNNTKNYDVRQLIYVSGKTPLSPEGHLSSLYVGLYTTPAELYNILQGTLNYLSFT